MSTRIWKLNNLERYAQLRKILLLPCREFHPPESWMKWEICSVLIVCSILDLWRYQVHWPDKIHCRPSKVITVFVWVSRLENPPSTLFSSSIEFSTMELILLYSASIAMSQCTVLMHLCVQSVHHVHNVRRYDSSLEVSWTSSSGKRFPANYRWRVKQRLRYTIFELNKIIMLSVLKAILISRRNIIFWIIEIQDLI